MAWEDALSAYEKFTFEDGPWTRPVWRRGQGPAVIIIHEIPGLHPLGHTLRRPRGRGRHDGLPAQPDR
jgi:dienelactone hydrolase